MVLSDLQSMAREEGEGMETTETESPSPALTPLPSLEHLLASPDPKQGVLERKDICLRPKLKQIHLYTSAFLIP